MGRTWPLGPDDEPVGWYEPRGAITGPSAEPEYQDAFYRDAPEEPLPVAPAFDWKPWRRARWISTIALLASLVYYATHIAWETWFFFWGCCIAWAVVFWSMRELKHRERLAKIDASLMREQLIKHRSQGHIRMGTSRPL